jgi:hypothetical protein
VKDASNLRHNAASAYTAQVGDGGVLRPIWVNSVEGQDPGSASKKFGIRLEHMCDVSTAPDKTTASACGNRACPRPHGLPGNLTGQPGRLTRMSAGLPAAFAAGLLVLVACGVQRPGSEPESGVTGAVHLGPQCPVESSTDPCDEQPASGVIVIVSEQVPGDAYLAGEEVARTTTNADGTFTVTLAPGEYVVTAEAGMSCELMDARVVRGAYAEVDIPCDTGIR